MNERLIPEAAYGDPNSVEMLRVWIAAKQLHCSMKIGMYKDRKDVVEENAWGIILADVARHIADALAQTCETKHGALLESIKSQFLEELDRPTSETRGGFIRRH